MECHNIQDNGQHHVNSSLHAEDSWGKKTEDGDHWQARKVHGQGYLQARLGSWVWSLEPIQWRERTHSFMLPSELHMLVHTPPPHTIKCNNPPTKRWWSLENPLSHVLITLEGRNHNPKLYIYYVIIRQSPHSVTKQSWSFGWRESYDNEKISMGNSQYCHGYLSLGVTEGMRQ